MAPTRALARLKRSILLATGPSNSEQGLRFLPDQERYRSDRGQHDQHRHVEANVRSATRPCPLCTYMPGSLLAFVGAADHRRVDWRFLVLGLCLSRRIAHQRLSLGPNALAMQV